MGGSLSDLEGSAPMTLFQADTKLVLPILDVFFWASSQWLAASSFLRRRRVLPRLFSHAMDRKLWRGIAASAVLFLSCIVLAQNPAPRLKISPNHRWLQYSDGEPFFYLGDTSWHLFPNVTREQADLYLANRAAKGFTVIQACVLNDVDEPNAYGDKPLIDRNPSTPNERYFRHVDYIVSKAEQLGLFVG